MPEETITKPRPAGSITNLTTPRARDLHKLKSSKVVELKLTESKSGRNMQQGTHIPKLDIEEMIPQTFSATKALSSEVTYGPKTAGQFRAKLPWLDGKPPSLSSERRIATPRLPGAFEPESPTSSSENFSKDLNIYAESSEIPAPKAESGLSKGNTRIKPSLPWIKRPDGSSPALSSANVSPTTPMTRNRRKTEIYLSDESARDVSSLSSDATPEVMAVPIDVRNLGNLATSTKALKVETPEISGSSSTVSSSRTSVTESYDHMRNNLPSATGIDHQPRQLAVSFNNPSKEEPVKVIDFMQSSKEVLGKASDTRASRTLAYIDPTPISDASSLTSSLAYDLASVASVDVEMEGSTCQSNYHRPNFSTRDIKIGESARSFRHKSGTGNSDPMSRGNVASRQPFLQGQSAKRVSFHPNVPLNIEPIRHHNYENEQIGPSALLGSSDVRRRHGKHDSIQIPFRSSSVKNLDVAQKDAAADSSAYRYGEATDEMGHIDLGLRQKDEGEYNHRNEEMTGVSVYRKNYNHKETGSSFRKYKHRPVARNWKNQRKRIVALVACFNTGLIGYIVGIYAGEVPRIQYQLGDEENFTIQGNVVLYLSIALSTLLFWPLPLLHGRKPYILGALSIVLPLQFPQAISVGSPRMPDQMIFRIGLLLPRALSGFVLGFANVNSITMLFDLFGVSLQSQHPHQELVYVNDPRRHGGGLGIWLGIWSWCFIASLSIGFLTGAGIITRLEPAWGFYIATVVVAIMLLLNIIIPETRRAMYRQAVADLTDEHGRPARVRARGEIKLHISADGPEFWFEEVFAGIKLSMRMLSQFGFAVLAIYLGWIYAQIVLAQSLLGALLSGEYSFYPQYVGLGVFSIALGAFLAIPLSRASLFSRSRSHGPRTNSMTVEARVTWTSHLFRRILFTLTLPFVALGYTLVSTGDEIPFILPCLFAGAIGFLSNLAISECYGILMEAFDTSDLQPGVNSRHRLQSMATITRRRRTNYSSFPRVSAGIFVSQSFAFAFAAIATAVGGVLTRGLGAQAATGVFAGILLFLTLLLTLVLWRFKEVQVIPTHLSATQRQTGGEFEESKEDDYWQPVIIGNPSGKTRRMNLVEMGSLSRWTEIRRLNKLIQDDGALFY